MRCSGPILHGVFLAPVIVSFTMASAFAQVSGAAAEDPARAVADAFSDIEDIVARSRPQVEAAKRRLQGILPDPDAMISDAFSADIVQELSDGDGFDAMIPDFGPGPTDELRVFASFSMPEDMLVAYVQEAHLYGGQLVFRGFVDDNMAATTQAFGRIVQKAGGVGSAVVDPKPFEVFSISEVPAVVLSDGELDACRSQDCEVETPVHDKLAGATSLRYALGVFSSEGDLPEVALRRLGR